MKLSNEQKKVIAYQHFDAELITIGSKTAMLFATKEGYDMVVVSKKTLPRMTHEKISILRKAYTIPCKTKEEALQILSET